MATRTLSLNTITFSLLTVLNMIAQPSMCISFHSFLPFSVVFRPSKHSISSPFLCHLSSSLPRTKIFAMFDPKKKINVKLFRLFLVAIIFLRALPAEADIILQNQLEVPMSVCSNDGSEPIALPPNRTISIQKPPGLLSFWSCKAGNSRCINAQEPIATMAVLNISDDSISYWLSAEHGYNFALRIMCFDWPSCEAITCKANLDNCPPELRIRDPNPNGAVVAYSHCQMPSSWDDPSSDSKTCLDSRYLLVSFIDS